ncbi:MAG TPA: hypothetical protein VF173_20220 [Thermoanaerobaculia bacterium]|nr:hypothetical protein [Thermoanaerobaculia bacterium]
MVQPSSRRWRATLVLAAALLVLALPAARAAERPAPPRAVAGPGLAATLWNALTRLWAQEGSGLDPDGSTKTVDEGGGLDPSGRTQAATGDAGSGLDPSGRQ